MQFNLDKEQLVKLTAWEKEVRKKAIEKQKEEIDPNSGFYDAFKACWDAGYPYSGAIGGALTYSFAPTSLGVVVTVTEAISDEDLEKLRI